MTKKKIEPFGRVSFWMGIVSIFFGFVVIIPLSGFALGLISLFKYNKDQHKNAWYAWIGVILNAIYILVALYHMGIIAQPQ